MSYQRQISCRTRISFCDPCKLCYWPLHYTLTRAGNALAGFQRSFEREFGIGYWRDASTLPARFERKRISGDFDSFLRSLPVLEVHPVHGGKPESTQWNVRSAQWNRIVTALGHYNEHLAEEWQSRGVQSKPTFLRSCPKSIQELLLPNTALVYKSMDWDISGSMLLIR